MTSPSRRPPPGWEFRFLPRTLRNQLRAIARRTVLRRWLVGLSLMAGALLVLLPLQAAWDWMADLGRPARSALLVLDFLVAAGFFWHFGWRGFRARHGPEACALLAERHWDDFRSGLISAVQFSRHEPTPLTSEIVRSVASLAAGRHLAGCVSMAPVRRPALAAGLLALINLIVFAVAWPLSGVLLARMALVNVPLPAATVLLESTGDIEVAAARSVTITAHVSGVIPAGGLLEISSAGRPLSVLPMAAIAGDRGGFSITLQNVQEPFTYRVIINDARSARFQVAILVPPATAMIGFQQIYPAYTGLEPVPRAPGNMELLAGSRLAISGEATQDLRSATVIVPGGQPVPLKVSGRKFSGALPIPASGLDSFSVSLVNEKNTPSAGDTAYQVTVIPDMPPVVAWSPDDADLLIHPEKALRPPDSQPPACQNPSGESGESKSARACGNMARASEAALNAQLAMDGMPGSEKISAGSETAAAAKLAGESMKDADPSTLPSLQIATAHFHAARDALLEGKTGEARAATSQGQQAIAQAQAAEAEAQKNQNAGQAEAQDQPQGRGISEGMFPKARSSSPHSEEAGGTPTLPGVASSATSAQPQGDEGIGSGSSSATDTLANSGPAGAAAQVTAGVSPGERDAAVLLRTVKPPLEFVPEVRQYLKNLADETDPLSRP